jgi:hypothetical protein
MSAAIDLHLFDIDSAAISKLIPVGVLHLDSDTLTVRELIEQRIKQEISRYNDDTNTEQMTHLLVKPVEIEQRLNTNKNKRKINPDTQIKKALQAFQQNGFFILVDEQQVESLEETITITPDTKVSFFRLVPLVGG